MLHMGESMKDSKVYRLADINYPVKIADTFMSRFIGLMGKKHLDYGLLINPCNCVHTFFMKVPIDIVFLDKSHTVLGVKKNARPWRTVLYNAEACRILELPSGMADKLGITEGKHIYINTGGITC